MGVSLGADIGSVLYLRDRLGERRHAGVGTLGCFVDIKTHANSEWKRLALTNYHVVRPALGALVIGDGGGGVELIGPDSPALRADREGLKPFQSPSVFIEHPSRRRHNGTLVSLEERIERGEARGASTQVQLLREIHTAKTVFFDNGQYISGKIWAASGYLRRSGNNSRIDWALVEVHPSRPSSNVLSSLDTWSGIGDTPENAGCGPDGRLRLDTRGPSVEKFLSWDLAFKVGAVTGPTVGVYREFRAMTKYANDKHLNVPPSMERVFYGQDGKHFGLLGDSGAAVYNQNGLFVGILFTGLVPRQTDKENNTYVTPIEYVLEDIKAFTGVASIRLAPE